MSLAIFAAGVALGLSIAAPVGPMGLLCINRTLQRGLTAGLCVGAGIATGDAFYGGVAAFGLSSVTELLVGYALPLRLMGGAFLVWIGIQGWRVAETSRSARTTAPPAGLARDYLAAVALTLTNPATIISFIAAFGALSLASRQGGAGVLVIGVFLGSAAWWLGLCSVIATVRQALTPRTMAWIDRISAAILILFGAAAATNVL